MGDSRMSDNLIGRGKAIAERLNAQHHRQPVPGSRNSYADVPHPAEREEDRDSISTLLTGLLNAADLDKMTFPALTEHVPGLVVEGLTSIFRG